MARSVHHGWTLVARRRPHKRKGDRSFKSAEPRALIFGLHPKTRLHGPVGYGTALFRVELIPCRQAREIIIANHYSRTVVNNSYVHLGVFIRRKMVGVLQFGYLKNPRCMERIVWGTGIKEYLELNRMWLSDAAPRNSESKAIAYAIRYIGQAHPQVKWIQSFADERCGRWGVVYQAANFLYCGSHVTTFYRLDGKFYHEQAMSTRSPEVLRTCPAYRHLQAHRKRARKRSCRMFRYLYFIDRRARAGLRFKVQPYPKPERGPS